MNDPVPDIALLAVMSNRITFTQVKYNEKFPLTNQNAAPNSHPARRLTVKPEKA